MTDMRCDDAQHVYGPRLSRCKTLLGPRFLKNDCPEEAQSVGSLIRRPVLPSKIPGAAHASATKHVSWVTSAPKN